MNALEQKNICTQTHFNRSCEHDHYININACILMFCEQTKQLTNNVFE